MSEKPKETKACELCGTEYQRGELTIYGICQDCYTNFDSLDAEDQLAFLLNGHCPNCQD